ncbi:hypothetical protein [Methylobacterium gregans]|uniref:hypothetical protein n=1 Tax=Methylobacterium gregans TaxID=374424 RepID=UPI0036210699
MDVALRDLPDGEGVAVSRHPGGEVDIARAAERRQALPRGVLRGRALRLAGDRVVADLLAQGRRRGLAAAIGGSSPGLAGLRRLGRVDPVEVDAPALQLDRITVDHGRLAGDRLGGEGGRGEEQEERGQAQHRRL